MREPGFYYIIDQHGNSVPALWETDTWWSVSCQEEEVGVNDVGPKIEKSKLELCNEAISILDRLADVLRQRGWPVSDNASLRELYYTVTSFISRSRGEK